MSFSVIPREDNQSEVDKVDKDFGENNEFTEDNVDREEISWWLDVILNFKSQKEIAQDIADGILQMEEVENIFPWEYVQELRKENCEPTKNYLKRFKHMSGRRIKDVFYSLLGQNSYNNLINEIKDCFFSLDSSNVVNVVKHLINIRENTNYQSTCNTMSMIPGEVESGNALGTKKKRVAKKNANVNSNKKNEKPKNVGETTKKIKNVKLTKKKLSVNVDNENNIKEMISSKENQIDNENKPNDLIHSSSFQNEKSKESSFNDKKKNGDRSIGAGSIVVQNSVQKSKKMVTKRKPRTKKSNVPIISSSPKIVDEMEQAKKSKINENAMNDEKEEESNLTKSNGSRADFLTKTKNNLLLNLNKFLSNEATNVSNSKNGDEEIWSNQNQDIPDLQKSIQLDKNTSKQLNIDKNRFQVKTEPINFDSYESNPNGLNHYINPNEDNMSVNNLKKCSNSKAMPMNLKKSTNIPQKSELVKSPRISNCKKKNKNKPEHKVTKNVTNNRKTTLQRKKNQEEREREEKKIRLRKFERKIRNNLEDFKDEMTKLIKDMRNVGVDEKESSDCSTEYSCSDISSTSSYTESSSESSAEWSIDSSTSVWYSGSSKECSCNCSRSDFFSKDVSSEY